MAELVSSPRVVALDTLEYDWEEEAK